MPFVLALSVCIFARGVSAQEDGETDSKDPASQILSLGEGGTTIYVVRHGERFSIFVESVPADSVFKALEPLGGPRYEYSSEFTRPVTLTMHDASIEQIVRKMLEGHSFTYHYSDGRLALVRVLPQITGRTYKTPPAVESRSRWTEIEIERIASRNARAESVNSGDALRDTR